MLKEHNREAYEATKNMLLEHRECCLVAATGIGKSNITTELIQELGLNALIIAPKASIRDEWTAMPDKYDIPPTFSTMTYQYFVRHYENLYGFDAYIFDEAHHTGATKWGKIIKKFREGLDTEFVLGLTADPNRYSDKCKRDKENKIISSVVRSVFNGHGIYGHDQRSAIKNGILPRATYVCSIYNADEMFDKYEAMDLTEELRGRLNYTRTNCEAIEDTLRRNVPNEVPVKGIVFVDSIANIDIGVRLARRAFPREAVHYIHSKLSAKENAETLEMFKKAKSGFIVSVDMIGEGLHIAGINTVIMLRKTGSPSIYTQQIGRGLAAGSNDATIFDFVRNDTSIKKVLARIKNMSESYQNDENEEDDSEEDNADNGGRHVRYPKISDQFIIKDKASDILEVFDEIDEYCKKVANGSWTKEELDILKENYPSIGSDVYRLLKNRTKTACSCCASKLGLRKIRKYKKWTKEEDEILIRNYPNMGSDVYKTLTNRTMRACLKRARTLGLTVESRDWSDEEDQIIKEKYPEMGRFVYILLPKRNETQCTSRASALGVKYIGKNTSKWTDDEDKVIIENYKSMGTSVCELLPGRSAEACKSRAKKLGVTYEEKSWSESEDKIIIEHFGTMGENVYKIVPNRTKAACKNRAHKLGLYAKDRHWTEAEDSILREYYPVMGGKVYTLLHDRTKGACQARAIKDLGLRFKR